MLQKLSIEVQSAIRSGIALTDTSQCVVELVENALDAKSTCIAVRVDLENYMIQVVDNGHGLTKEELDLVGTRYMTNKCNSLTDLTNKIKYYGYRGESLASLRGTCGMMMLISKVKGSKNTYTKVFKSKNESKNATVSAHDRLCVGTTVVVKDFLVTLPVRRARIQPALEMQDIKHCLQILSIINYKVSFTLRNDTTKAVILQTQVYNDIADALRHHCNLSTDHCLIKVSFDDQPFKLTGYISRETEPSGRFQFIYVNKRMVMNKSMYKLVERGLSKSFYLRNIGKEIKSDNNKPKEKPSAVFIISIQCAHIECDFTSDPRKFKVEFKDWGAVNTCLGKLIDKFLVTESNLKIAAAKPDKITEEHEVLDASSKCNNIPTCNVVYGTGVKRQKTETIKEVDESKILSSLKAANNTTENTQSKVNMENLSFENAKPNECNTLHDAVNDVSNTKITETIGGSIQTNNNLKLCSTPANAQPTVNKINDNDATTVENPKTFINKKHISLVNKEGEITKKEISVNRLVEGKQNTSPSVLTVINSKLNSFNAMELVAGSNSDIENPLPFKVPNPRIRPTKRKFLTEHITTESESDLTPNRNKSSWDSSVSKVHDKPSISMLPLTSREKHISLVNKEGEITKKEISVNRLVEGKQNTSPSVLTVINSKLNSFNAMELVAGSNSDIENPLPFKVPNPRIRPTKRKFLTEHITTESESDLTPNRNKSSWDSSVSKVHEKPSISMLPLTSREMLNNVIKNIAIEKSMAFNRRGSKTYNAMNIISSSKRTSDGKIQINLYRRIRENANRKTSTVTQQNSIEYFTYGEGNCYKYSERSEIKNQFPQNHDNHNKIHTRREEKIIDNKSRVTQDSIYNNINSRNPHISELNMNFSKKGILKHPKTNTSSRNLKQNRKLLSPPKKKVSYSKRYIYISRSNHTVKSSELSVTRSKIDHLQMPLGNHVNKLKSHKYTNCKKNNSENLGMTFPTKSPIIYATNKIFFDLNEDSTENQCKKSNDYTGVFNTKHQNIISSNHDKFNKIGQQNKARRKNIFPHEMTHNYENQTQRKFSFDFGQAEDEIQTKKHHQCRNIGRHLGNTSDLSDHEIYSSNTLNKNAQHNKDKKRNNMPDKKYHKNQPQYKMKIYKKNDYSNEERNYKINSHWFRLPIGLQKDNKPSTSFGNKKNIIPVEKHLPKPWIRPTKRKFLSEHITTDSESDLMPKWNKSTWDKSVSKVHGKPDVSMLPFTSREMFNNVIKNIAVEKSIPFNRHGLNTNNSMNIISSSQSSYRRVRENANRNTSTVTQQNNNECFTYGERHCYKYSERSKIKDQFLHNYENYFGKSKNIILKEKKVSTSKKNSESEHDALEERNVFKDDLPQRVKCNFILKPGQSEEQLFLHNSFVNPPIAKDHFKTEWNSSFKFNPLFPLFSNLRKIGHFSNSKCTQEVSNREQFENKANLFENTSQDLDFTTLQRESEDDDNLSSRFDTEVNSCKITEDESATLKNVSPLNQIIYTRTPTVGSDKNSDEKYTDQPHVQVNINDDIVVDPETPKAGREENDEKIYTDQPQVQVNKNDDIVNDTTIGELLKESTIEGRNCNKSLDNDKMSSDITKTCENKAEVGSNLELKNQVYNNNWNAETFPDGKVIYIHPKTGMSSFLTPRGDSDITYQLQNRHWFMPKGTSPLLDLKNHPTDSINKLTESEKTIVQTIVTENTDDLARVKWKCSNFQGVESILATMSGTDHNIEWRSRPSLNRPCVFSNESLHNAKVIGQVDSKFIAAIMQPKDMSNSVIVLFDQHAVDERICLENLISGYKQDGKLVSEKVNPGIEAGLNKNERDLLIDLMPKIIKFGLSFEIQENKILVMELPLCLLKRSKREGDSPSIIITAFLRQLLLGAEKFKGIMPNLPAFLVDIINSEACRGAIKFGDKLTLEECKQLILKLSQCEIPFQCAHGRPVLATLMDFEESKPEEPINLAKLRRNVDGWNMF